MIRRHSAGTSPVRHTNHANASNTRRQTPLRLSRLPSLRLPRYKSTHLSRPSAAFSSPTSFCLLAKIKCSICSIQFDRWIRSSSGVSLTLGLRIFGNLPCRAESSLSRLAARVRGLTLPPCDAINVVKPLVWTPIWIPRRRRWREKAVRMTDSRRSLIKPVYR